MALAATTNRAPCARATAAAAVELVGLKIGTVPVTIRAELKPGPAIIGADAKDAILRVWPADVSAGAAIERVAVQVHARVPA